MLSRKNVLLVAIIGVGSFLLASCAVSAEQVNYKAAVAPATKKVRKDLVKQLRHEGVQIIKLGETLRFVIKSDNLFNPNSANIRKHYKIALNNVAKLANTYDKVNVKVAAYTDNNGDIKHQQALTTRQAQVVAGYLWSRGIDARLEYAVGYNRKNPVASNRNSKGRGYNRRVEISFRYYPHPTPLV